MLPGFGAKPLLSSLRRAFTERVFLPFAGGRWRTPEDKLREYRTLEDFGAVGDDTADDSTALRDALAAGVPVKASPGKTYKVTELLEMASGSHLDLTGATINASAMTSQGTHTRVIRAFGTYGTPISLSANASEEALSVSAPNTGLVDGDMAMVYSAKKFDDSNTDTLEGEIVIVREADAATVTLQAPLRCAYTTANSAKIVKLTPKENISIRGGTIIGPNLGANQQHILDFRITKNVLVEGVVFKDVGTTCVRFCDSIFGKVAFCSFEGSAENTALAYGIAFGNASQDCIALGNSAYNRRHFITTTNQATDLGQVGITRRIKFQSNVMYRCALYTTGSTGDALDSHGGCEDIEILDNTIYYSTGQGINFEGRSGVIRGNTIYFAATNAIHVHNETDGTGQVVVSDNKIYGAGVGYNGILIEEGFRGAGYGYSGVVCCDNTIYIQGVAPTATGIYLNVDVAEAARPRMVLSGNLIRTNGDGMILTKIRNAVVSNNVVRGTSGITLSQPLNSTISANQIEPVSTTERGINSLGSKRCTYTGNMILMPDGSTLQAIYLADSGAVTPENNVVTGNIGSIPNAGTSLGFQQSAGASYTVVTSNNFRGFGTPFTVGAGVGHVNADNIS